MREERGWRGAGGDSHQSGALGECSRLTTGVLACGKGAMNSPLLPLFFQ